MEKQLTNEQFSELSKKLSESYLGKLDFLNCLSFSITAIECVLHPKSKEIFDEMLKTVYDEVDNKEQLLDDAEEKLRERL